MLRTNLLITAALVVGSLISAALVGCGGGQPPASIESPAKSGETAKTNGGATQAETTTPEVQIAPEVVAEVNESTKVEVKKAAYNKLLGKWRGVVVLNEEAVAASDIPAPVVAAMKSMTIDLTFNADGEAIMVAATQTPEGPTSLETKALWDIAASNGAEVVIGWQEEGEQPELNQLTFESDNIFTRPPPGGDEGNRDLGVTRFTRMQ